jgi:tRNA A37 threonylcarbamoyladenosine biosynthesis protein TsaE
VLVRRDGESNLLGQVASLDGPVGAGRTALDMTILEALLDD